MRKKGFTLMEMLGIIIILATILAIAMPKITDTIYEAQYKAFTNDVNELHGITKLEYNNKNEYRTYYFEDGKQVNIEEVGKLDFKGDNPGRGYIEIYQNGDIEFELVSKNGKFCASKSINEEKAVIQRCNKINTSEKFTLKTSYISTTNSILVTLIPKNGEKDVVITDYYYRLDNGKIINSSKANHLFKKLKNTDENGNAKKYNITVKACSKSGTCKEEKINATMQLIGDIKYTITKIPDLEDTDWAKEKTITFEYPDLKDIEGNSIGINEISTDGKTFTKYTEKITVKEDTTFVARVSDGTNSITSASIKVIKFDYEAPTITNVSGNPSNWTNKNVTIVVNGASDNGKSGLAEKAYKFDNGPWQKENSKTYTSNGKVVIQVKDKLDNIYTQTFDITKIDKTGPVCGGWNGQNTTWTKNDVTVYATCGSDLGSGCKSSQSSGVVIKETAKTKNVSAIIEDNVGNQTTCKGIVNAYVDKTSPTPPIIQGGFEQPTWSNQDATISISKDGETGPSGLSHYKYTIRNYLLGAPVDRHGQLHQMENNNGNLKSTGNDPYIDFPNINATNVNKILIIFKSGYSLPSGTMIQVFYIRSGQNEEYSEERSKKVVATGTANSIEINMPKDAKNCKSLRVDLGTSPNVTYKIQYIMYVTESNTNESKFQNKSWIVDEGYNDIYYQTVDNLGRISKASNIRYAKIDKTKPTFYWHDTNNNQILNNASIPINQPIQITCSDGLSGQKNIIMGDDANKSGGASLSNELAQVISGNSNPSWRITGTCWDNAGNERTETMTFNIYDPTPSGGGNSGGGSSGGCKKYCTKKFDGYSCGGVAQEGWESVNVSYCRKYISGSCDSNCYKKFKTVNRYCCQY